MSAALVEETFQTLLPAGVAARATLSGTIIDPYPEEAALVTQAIDSRRAEFLTSRRLARAALGELGISCGAIGRDAQRQPVWPEGVVASITHTAGVCAAAAARSSDLAAIGIDLERLDRAMSAGVVERIAPHPDEQAVRELFGDQWSMVVFCAKEAVFKALDPTVGEYFGFDEVVIRPDAGTLRVEYSDWLAERVAALEPISLSAMVTNDHTHCAAVVPVAS